MFDDLIEGGIPEQSTILITGGPGSGKTLWCLQQLHWAAAHGEKVLFMSFEETEERLVGHMASFGLNIKRYIITKKYNNKY